MTHKYSYALESVKSASRTRQLNFFDVLNKCTNYKNYKACIKQMLDECRSLFQMFKRPRARKQAYDGCIEKFYTKTITSFHETQEEKDKKF